VTVAEYGAHSVMTPRVTVALRTYNHAPYIGQALESALAQRTSFPVEIVVGDDCSTDGARDIIVASHRAHPDRIRLVFPERNLGQGGRPMVAATIEAARGEFVATLDGDDYWTDERKLQRQVEFLDAHPECSMCFHDVLEVIEDGSRSARRLNESAPAELTGIDDILAGCYIGACSPLMRSAVVKPLPAWFVDMPMGDWQLYVLAAEKGPIGFIPAVMGAYRIHAGGLWNSLDKVAQYEHLLSFYAALDVATEGRLRQRIRRAEGRWHYKMALELNRRRQLRRAGGHALRALVRRPRAADIDWPLFFKESAWQHSVGSWRSLTSRSRG
jgi:glycosyltransferase involved in cell wall biosynthesis